MLFIYSWETQRERAETQAEGETGSIQGARYGTWDHTLSQRQMLNLWATRHPFIYFKDKSCEIFFFLLQRKVDLSCSGEKKIPEHYLKRDIY